MKKLNCLPLVFIFAFILFSCKSTPVGNQVNPIDLLDSNSAFYICIPSSADPDLITQIIQNNVDGLAEKDAKLLSERINSVYCGLNRTRKTVELEASVSADIPIKYVNKVLNEKNGWAKVDYTPEKSKNTYCKYSRKDLTLAFPNSKLAVFGENLDERLDYFDYLAWTTDELPFNHSKLEDDLYIYLTGAEETNEIRFYANKPQSFLTILLGTNLDLKLTNVCGSFVIDADCPDQYLLNLDFNFKNAKFLKAGKALLNLAFELTSSQSSVNDTELKIENIHISREQVQKLLNIN